MRVPLRMIMWEVVLIGSFVCSSFDPFYHAAINRTENWSWRIHTRLWLPPPREHDFHLAGPRINDGNQLFDDNVAETVKWGANCSASEGSELS